VKNFPAFLVGAEGEEPVPSVCLVDEEEAAANVVPDRAAESARRGGAMDTHPSPRGEMEELLLAILDEEEPPVSVAGVGPSAVGVKTAADADSRGAQDPGPVPGDVFDQDTASVLFGTTLEPAGRLPRRPGGFGEAPLSCSERGDVRGVHAQDTVSVGGGKG
jgi:hypothetical protein